MKLSVAIATADDAPTIASLLNDTALQLTTIYGKGHWSYQTSERGVLHGMQGKSTLLIAKHKGDIVGTLRLATKKPWAIDTAYFTQVLQVLYLTGMAVAPDLQRMGIGKYMLQQINSYVTEWPAQAVRLDAYDAAAGAGEFYRKCGYTEKGRVIYKGNPLIYFEMLFDQS